MDKTCTECGGPVSRSLLCRSCSRRAVWARQRPPGWTPPTCKTCGGEITSSAYRAVYCSAVCKFADPEVRAKLGPPRNRVTKTCPNCSKDFEVPVSNDARYTCCSKACSSAYRGRGAICARCGAAFRHSRTQTRRYCSEACRRPPVEIDCGNCGTTFRVIPSRQSRSRYCSPRCYRASGAETSIERTVRLALAAAGYDFRSQVQVGPWVVDFMAGNLAIEADGTYWHSQRPDVDRRKNNDLAGRGYAVWRLPDTEIGRPDFGAVLNRRLVDYEVTNGELPRLTPDQITAALADEHRVVRRHPQRWNRRIPEVHPDQLTLGF